MLDIKFIRENPDKVKESLKNRGMHANVDELLSLDKKRREIISELDSLRHNKKIDSEKIAKLKKDGKNAEEEIQHTKMLSQKTKKLELEVGDVEKKLYDLSLDIPNIPHNTVPVGPGPEENRIIRSYGEIPQFDFRPLTHIEIGTHLNIIDFVRPTKIVGSNFILYRSKGAKLERALIWFMLDLHTKNHGYTEILPPFLVNRRSMTSTGQLPKLEQDMYSLKDDDYFLVPTAEVPVTNIHQDEVLDEDDLPIYYVAYTPCFRREAGSYGKDTKGLIRVHQFDKVELVKFVKPENSYEELEKLVKDAEKVLQLLELQYRVVALSTGDLSFAASKCYDLEVYASGSKLYLEVSSCSNYEDFQVRRANIKYKDKKTGKISFVHTLNGSGVALARTLIAIMENYQQKDGSMKIPEVLKPYMDNQEFIKSPLQ